MAIKQTAGHDQWEEFAPLFAEINDDVLFVQHSALLKTFMVIKW